MEGYLGETILDISKTEYKDYDKGDWALLYIEMYGGIDGSHHKAWVMDQVVRILNGTKVILSKAEWKNGTINHRFNLDEPSQKYLDWVKEYEGEEDDGEIMYEYDIGIAP